MTYYNNFNIMGQCIGPVSRLLLIIGGGVEEGQGG
jgi:hypothetical protein